MRKMVIYEDFEKARFEMCTTEEKMRKMVKYKDFEKTRIEMCTAESNEENSQI